LQTLKSNALKLPWFYGVFRISWENAGCFAAHYRHSSFIQAAASTTRQKYSYAFIEKCVNVFKLSPSENEAGQVRQPSTNP
jgi:hypothetical protein